MATSELSGLARLSELGSIALNRCVHAVAVLGVADLLADGPRHVEELAALSGAHPQSLYRIMRALASEGIFTQVGPDRFALNPPAEPLLSEAPAGSALDSFIGSPHRWAAWGEMAHTARTGETAFQKAHGMSYFDWLRCDPEGSDWFNRNMRTSGAAAVSASVEAYDFSSMATVVDVGGGTGALLGALLRAEPGVRGVLFDLPQVVEQARPLLDTAGLAARCSLVAGDFFEWVPGGGDAYLLARVLHDWDDERAAHILRRVREAVASHGRIIVIEELLGPPGSPDPGKLLDIVMMVMTGGRERTEEEYSALFTSAGFRLSRVLPTAARHSLLEGVPV